MNGDWFELKMNIVDIKQNNYNRIYFYLREKRQATKQEITLDLNLSLPTVTQHLLLLISCGLVSRERKVSKRTGGRNPVAYSFVPDAKVAVGLDITRHHVKSIVVDLDGTIIKYVHRRKEYSRSDDYLKMLGTEIENIIAMAELDQSKILGVGISVPGLIDRTKEIVVDGRVIDNTGMSREDFSRYIPFKTKLIHDSAAAALSEIIRSPDIHNACYLSLCNSIGGSVFVNDKVYHGDGLYICEFGHLNLIPNGRPCYCGQKGCFEPYCNTEALSAHSQGDLFTFFDQLANGNQEFAEIWDTYLDHLAILITEIRMMFGSSIIIGGDIGRFIDRHMPYLQSKVDARSPFGEKSAQFLYPCRNKMEAIATGSALHFVQDFFDSDLVNLENSNEEVI